MSVIAQSHKLLCLIYIEAKKAALDLPLDLTMSDTEMLDGNIHEGPEPSDEGEGEDVGALSDDSSEEAATDEEEAINVRKDFIVDDDDEEAESSEADEEAVHKKRRKRRRKREH